MRARELARLGATALLAAGCSTEPAGAGGFGASGQGAGGSGASGGAGGAAAPPDAGPTPQGEAGWIPVAWNAPCPVEVATRPELGVPRLEWESCGEEAPGCERISMVGEDGKGVGFGPPSVQPEAGGYRIGLFFRDSIHRQFAAVYEVDGTPIAAWTTELVWEQGSCLSMLPRLHKTHVWYGVQSNGDVTASGSIHEPYENLTKATKMLVTTHTAQGVASSENTLALWETGGTRVTVFDRLSSTAKTFGSTPSHKMAYPVGDSAFLLVFAGYNQPEGWIWNRATHTTEPLVQVLPDIVRDIKSDGKTIVWIRTPPIVDGKAVAGDVWTSPFATSKAGLVPTKRRPAPLAAYTESAANEGYYAIHGGNHDRKVHIYRLSDMHHWEFQPPEEKPIIYDVSYVDTKYVYYRTFPNVYRQALDALGPGDAAP